MGVQVRWHPDKFTARFGGRLAKGSREAVTAGVQALSQLLTSLASSGKTNAGG